MNRGGISRKLEPKPTASADLGFDTAPTVHACNRFLHDGQADSCAGVIFAAMQPLKDTEDPVMMFLRNADSVVFHPDANGAVANFFTNADLGGFVGGDELDCIGNEIHHHLD